MSRPWTLEEARSGLGELLNAAAEHLPQAIRLPDGREVIVISKEEHGRLLRTTGGIPAETKAFLLEAGTAPQDDPLDAFTDD